MQKINEMITELEKGIEEAEKVIIENKAAISALNRLSESNIKSKSDSAESFSLSNPVFKLPPRKRTQADNIKSILHLFGDQEFSVGHVEIALKENNKEIVSKNPRARIAMVLSTLEENDFVERTYKPVGNEPHRFKATSKGLAYKDE